MKTQTIRTLNPYLHVPVILIPLSWSLFIFLYYSNSNSYCSIPDLHDSILSFFIIKLSLIDFPNLPVFSPSDGALFFQEHLLAFSVIYKFLSLIGVSSYCSFGVIIALTFLVNFTVLYIYIYKSGLSPTFSMIISFSCSFFPYLWENPGHLHVWPIFILAAISFEICDVKYNTPLRIWNILVIFTASIFFSISFSYMLIITLALFLILRPDVLIASIQIFLLNFSQQMLFLIIVIIYQYFGFSYNHFNLGDSGNFDITQNAYYAIQFVDLIDKVIFFGLIPQIDGEAQKFPVFFSIAFWILIFSAYTNKGKISGFPHLFIMIVVMMALSLGPNIEFTESISISNWVFLFASNVPGFDGLRVVNRFLFPATYLCLAVAVYSISRGANQRSWMLPLIVLCASSMVVQWNLYTPERGHPVPDARLSSVDALAANYQISVLAHVPFTESKPAAYDYLLFSLQSSLPTVNGVTTYFPSCGLS